MNHESTTPKTNMISSQELRGLNEVEDLYHDKVTTTEQELADNEANRRASALKDSYDQHDKAMDALHEVKAIPGFRRSATQKVNEWTANRDITTSREVIDNYVDQETPEDAALRQELAEFKQGWDEFGGPALDAAREDVAALNFKSNATDRIKAKGALHRAEATLFHNLKDVYIDDGTDAEPTASEPAPIDTPEPTSEPITEPIPTSEPVTTPLPSGDPDTRVTRGSIEDAHDPRTIQLDPNDDRKTFRRDYSPSERLGPIDTQEIRQRLAAEGYDLQAAERARAAAAIDQLQDMRAQARDAIDDLVVPSNRGETTESNSGRPLPLSKVLGTRALMGIRGSGERRRISHARRIERGRRMATRAKAGREVLRRSYNRYRPAVSRELVSRINPVRIGTIMKYAENRFAARPMQGSGRNRES